MEGSVEIAPYIDPNVVAIADIVGSGKTARVNGIDVIEPELIRFDGAVWVIRTNLTNSDVIRGYGGGGEII